MLASGGRGASPGPAAAESCGLWRLLARPRCFLVQPSWPALLPSWFFSPDQGLCGPLGRCFVLDGSSVAVLKSPKGRSDPCSGRTEPLVLKSECPAVSSLHAPSAGIQRLSAEHLASMALILMSEAVRRQGHHGGLGSWVLCRICEVQEGQGPGASRSLGQSVPNAGSS